MKTVITAIANPIINNELKKEKNIEVIGNDIQYKDGVIEILEKNIEVNYIILSDILIGEELLINLIRKINSEEEKEMLAILDTIAEENERILQQGIKETTINNAKKMKKANIDIKLIMEITGLKKEEIERL